MWSSHIIQRCIVPFWVKLYLFRLKGRNFVDPDGTPSWCITEADPLQIIAVQSISNNDTDSDSSNPIENGDSLSFSDDSKLMIIAFTYFLVISFLYNVIDIALSMAIWSAASVGTPTEPRGRDKALRSIIWLKVICMNLLLAFVLGSGIYLVAHGRKTNYGCGGDANNEKVQYFEVSILLVP